MRIAPENEVMRESLFLGCKIDMQSWNPSILQTLLNRELFGQYSKFKLFKYGFWIEPFQGWFGWACCGF